MTIQKPMTLQKAKSIARHLGLTVREVCSGNYRVNFRDGNETTAYYTDNLEDAVKTAVEIARSRVANAGAEAEPVAQPMILATMNKFWRKATSPAGDKVLNRVSAIISEPEECPLTTMLRDNCPPLIATPENVIEYPSGRSQ